MIVIVQTKVLIGAGKCCDLRYIISIKILTYVSISVSEWTPFFSLALTEKLREPGKYPGCSGTRNLHDNLSDLKAQVAANHKVTRLSGRWIFPKSL